MYYYFICTNCYHMAHYTSMMPQYGLCIWSLCSRVVVLICAIWSLCVIYNVKCLWFLMCSTNVCYVYTKQLWCVCGQSSAWNQLMDVLNQLFVILHAYVTNLWIFCLVPKYLCYVMDEFFVWWSLLLLSYQIYVLLTRESNYLTIFLKKNINLGHFLVICRRTVYRFRYR
jgi:hypothetical protein